MAEHPIHVRKNLYVQILNLSILTLNSATKNALSFFNSLHKLNSIFLI